MMMNSFEEVEVATHYNFSSQLLLEKNGIKNSKVILEKIEILYDYNDTAKINLRVLTSILPDYNFTIKVNGYHGVIKKEKLKELVRIHRLKQLTI